MHFILILGPQAVGKMSVGECLARETGAALLHNHSTIECLLPLFPFHSPEFQRLNLLMRCEILKALGQSQRSVVFTYMWNLDDPGEWDTIRSLIEVHGNSAPEDVYYIELAAPMGIREIRNTHPDRLDKKPSKRDLALSTYLLQNFEKIGRSNTEEGEVFDFGKNHLRIDNSQLSPEQVTSMILQKFPELQRSSDALCDD